MPKKSKEPSPVKRIMSRNQEKQAELFPERVNETASLDSAKPKQNTKTLARLNSLSSRRKSLITQQNGIFCLLTVDLQKKRNFPSFGCVSDCAKTRKTALFHKPIFHESNVFKHCNMIRKKKNTIEIVFVVY